MKYPAWRRDGTKGEFSKPPSIFYDLHTCDDHLFTDNDADNGDHHSTAGAIKVTTRLKTVANLLLEVE